MIGAPGIRFHLFVFEPIFRPGETKKQKGNKNGSLRSPDLKEEA